MPESKHYCGTVLAILFFLAVVFTVAAGYGVVPSGNLSAAQLELLDFILLVAAAAAWGLLP